MMIEEIKPTTATLAGTPKEIWDAAVEDFRAAKGAFETYQRDIVTPAGEKELAHVGQWPGTIFEVHFPNGTSMQFQMPKNDLHIYDGEPHLARHARRLRRKIERYERLCIEAEEMLGLDAIYEEHDRLFDQFQDAEAALMELAAPDVQALSLKISVAFEGYRGEAPNKLWTVSIWEDAARIGGSASEG